MPTQQTQKASTASQAATQTIPKTPKYKIITSNVKVKLFPTKKPFKNKHFTVSKRKTKKQCAKAFCRPKRHFFYNPPFYPYCVPEPIVNFALGYKI